MNDKTLDMLQQLASKLGQTVDYLWPHTVRYVVVDALTDMATALFVILLAVFGAPRFWRYARTREAALVADAEAENAKRVETAAERGAGSYYSYYYPVTADTSTHEAFRWGVALVAALATIVAALVFIQTIEVVVEPVGYLVAKAMAGVPK